MSKLLRYSGKALSFARALATADAISGKDIESGQYFNGENYIFDIDNDDVVSANDFHRFRLRFGGGI